MSRIILFTVMTGPIAGFETVLKEFLAANDVGCVLATTTIEFGNTTSYLTMLMMEGDKGRLFEIRDLLVLELDGKFPGIKYDDWDPVDNESNKPWPKLVIKRTSFVDEKIATSINERISKAAKKLGGRIINPENQDSPLLSTCFSDSR